MKFMKKFASEEIRNKTNDSEEEQQVLLDNRKVGEESLNTYDTYYGRIRQIIDSIKDIHYLPDRGRLKVRLKYNLQY